MIPLDSVFMLLVVFLMPVVLYFFMKLRTLGKLGCFFLEKDKSITFKLHKVSGPHVQVGDELFGISPGRIRFLRYPMNFPSIFQQIVPCSMYQREDYQPLDINDPINWTILKGSNDSSIEISAVLEPRWLAAIVRGTREGASEQTKFQRLMPALTLGAVAAVLVFMFYLVMKMNGMSGEIAHLEDLVNLAK